MLHDVEVDQSGRTDTLTVDTVLAFSDGIQSVILIPKAVKRKCYELLKGQGMRRDLISVKLFGAGLVLLLSPHIRRLTLIVIDLGYPGRDNEIREHLTRRLQETFTDMNSGQITFRQVGKSSNSHKIALAVYRGERQPDRRIQFRELLDVIT